MFSSNKKNDFSFKSKKNKFVFAEHELGGLKNLLDHLPLDMEVEDFINYLTKAIQARESSKFIFTRNLSSALDLMIKYGEETLGLSREDVGYFTYDDVRAIRVGELNEKLVSHLVKFRKEDFAEKQLAKLPSFICKEEDFFGFEQGKSHANFITRLYIVATLAFLKSDLSISIADKIIAIPNADPGFDWIFSHNISGLITKYGGANSHMAIRCAELNIPAAIGIGSKLYDELYEGRLKLDCKNEIFEYV